jgi:hypothetical protein
MSLQCPFCGSPESDRIDLEGRRFLVFACMFTPEVDPRAPDPELAQRLATDFGPQGSGYFRRTCDALHLHVTKGEAADALRGRRGPTAR